MAVAQVQQISELLAGILHLGNITFVNIEGKKVLQVSCGFKHTACITEDGELYTWGSNKQG